MRDLDKPPYPRYINRTEIQIDGIAMALSLKDPETDRLAREVAALTGETLTEAVRKSLAERLERERVRRGRNRNMAKRLREIGEHYASLPDVDPRSPDEIIGYDETGMWT
jgi:antitoxin VapB